MQEALATAATARDQALKDQEQLLIQQRTDALAEQKAANDQEQATLISDHRQELEAMNARLDKSRVECETPPSCTEKSRCGGVCPTACREVLLIRAVN